MTAIIGAIAFSMVIVMASYLSLNTIMNAISRSKKERFIMTPLSLISAICFWITTLNM